MSKVAFFIAGAFAVIGIAAAVMIAKAQSDPTIWYHWLLTNKWVVPLLFSVAKMMFLVALREWMPFRVGFWTIAAKIVPDPARRDPVR
ncbi:MAG: hypothetical protein M3Y72_11145 [Acidobacteriota bacterium]|nr:hypothetical protein [Acidobacteriota bacterium]